ARSLARRQHGSWLGGVQRIEQLLAELGEAVEPFTPSLNMTPSRGVLTVGAYGPATGGAGRLAQPAVYRAGDSAQPRCIDLAFRTDQWTRRQLRGEADHQEVLIGVELIGLRLGRLTAAGVWWHRGRIGGRASAGRGPRVYAYCPWGLGKAQGTFSY